MVKTFFSMELPLKMAYKILFSRLLSFRRKNIIFAAYF